jgi:hypothetical protein
VELLVESTDVTVAIPKFERDRPKPPVILGNGSTACPRHPETQATFRCTFCKETMCNACVHIMRLQGGQPLYLCRLCSHKCERIVTETPQKKKKGFVGFLDTVKLKFGYLREKPRK